MTKGRRVLAGICAFLFIVSAFVSLLLFNLERTIFSAETYKQAFRQQGLSAEIPALFVGMVAASAQEPGNNAFAFVSRLDRDDLELVITAMLPPEEFEALMDGFLDSAFAFLNGEADSISIPLLLFKRSMTGERGTQAVMQIILAQPECTLQQLAQMELGGDLIFCKPPDEAITLVAPLIAAQLQFMAGRVPDELVILSTAQSASLLDERAQLNRVRAAMRLSPLLSLVFLLAITFLAVRGLGDWLKWWGIPFLVAGLIGAIFSVAGSSVVSAVLVQLIKSRAPASMPLILLETGENLLAAIVRQFLKPVVIESIMLAVVGLAMILAAAYALPKKPIPPPDEAQTVIQPAALDT